MSWRALPVIRQLDEPLWPHSAEHKALHARESRYASPKGYIDSTRSASFPTDVNNVLTRFVTPPLPLEVLGAAKGRVYTEQELSRKFDHHLFPRRTNQYGCVTLHSYHFSIAEGLPHTQVLLWVSGEQLRAALSTWCWQSTAATMI